MDMKNRIAYNQATCKEKSDLETDLGLCEKFKVSGIELRFDQVDKYLATHSKEELRQLFEKTPVKALTVNAIFNINFCDEKDRERVCNLFEKACEIGELTGADCVIVIPSVDMDDKYSAEEIFEDSVQSLLALSKMGKPRNMKIAFEPIGDKGRMVKDIVTAWEIVKKTGDNNIGLAVDAYNLYLATGLSDVNAIENVDPERIFIVHMDDAPAKPIESLGTFERVAPGDGSIDLDAFVGAIKKTGYKGYYSIEILSSELWKKEPEVLFEDMYVKTLEVLNA